MQSKTLWSNMWPFKHDAGVVYSWNAHLALPEIILDEKQLTTQVEDMQMACMKLQRNSQQNLFQRWKPFVDFLTSLWAKPRVGVLGGLQYTARKRPFKMRWRSRPRLWSGFILLCSYELCGWRHPESPPLPSLNVRSLLVRHQFSRAFQLSWAWCIWNLSCMLSDETCPKIF